MQNQQQSAKSHKKQNLISIAILVFGTIGAFLIFGPKKELPEEVEKTPIALVETEALSEEEKTIKLEKTVTFSAGDEAAKAMAEFSGRIKEVKFSVGDYVYAGQILAVFDQSSLQNAPKVSWESAARSFEIAEENFSDTEDVVRRGSDLAKRAVEIAKLREDQAKSDPDSTSEEKDIAEENVKIAKDQEDQIRESGEIQKNAASLQLEQARLILRQAKIAYTKTFVKAPISGTIVTKKINAEAFLNAGDEIASIVGGGKIEAVAYLSQAEIDRIKLGDSAEIKIDEKIYAGKIDSFSKIANSDNERFEVKISSRDNLTGKANRTGSVILNFYLDSDLASGFFVPLDAVIIGQNKKEVYLVENGRAVSKTVELGKTFGTQIEVLSGLTVGEVLVVKNGRNLQNNQEVRVE